MNDNPVQTVSARLIWSAVVAGVFVVSSLTILLHSPPPYPYSNMLLTGIALVAVSSAAYAVTTVLVSKLDERREEDQRNREADREARRTFEDDVAEFFNDLIRAQKEQTDILKELAHDVARIADQGAVVPQQLEQCIQDLAVHGRTINGKIADLRNAWIEDGLPPAPLKELDTPLIERAPVVELRVQKDPIEEHGE